MCVIDVTACYVQIHPNGPSENFSNWNVICEANNHRMKQGEIAIREFTHITLNGADVFRSEWATQKPEFHFSLVIELDEIWIWKRAKKLYSRFTWCCCCKNEKSTEWDDKTRSASVIYFLLFFFHISNFTSTRLPFLFPWLLHYFIFACSMDSVLGNTWT